MDSHGWERDEYLYLADEKISVKRCKVICLGSYREAVAELGQGTRTSYVLSSTLSMTEHSLSHQLLIHL